MAWSKTFAASSIKSSLSALGNVTVKISEATEFTYDDRYGDNGTGFPIGSDLNIEVIRSSGTNVGNDGMAVRLFICDTATYDLHYIYWIYEATFRGTRKDADLHLMTDTPYYWDDAFDQAGSNSKSYLYMIATDDTMTYWTGLGACFTFNYAQNPAFDIAEFVEDNGDVPSGWANELFQGLSKPKFDIHMLNVRPHNSGRENNAQPYGISLADASGTFCGSTAVDQSASGTVAYDDIIDPTYELQFGYITNTTGAGTVTANSTRGTSSQYQFSHSVRAYSPPEIASLDTYRCDSSGNASDDGTYVKVELQGRIWASQDTQQSASVTVELFEGTNPDTANDTPVATKSLTLQFATSTWQQETASGSCVLGASGGIIHTQGITEDDTPGPAEVDKAYTVLVTIADDARSGSMSDVVPQAFYTMDFLAGGHGVAIGKPSTTDGLLDVGLDANFDGDVDVAGDITSGGEVSATDANDVVHKLTEKFPFSGGTVTGDLIVNRNSVFRPSGGSYVTLSNASAGTNGYLKVMTIVITGTYCNHAVVFTFKRRSDLFPTTVAISFNSANGTDPTLNSIKAFGQTNDVWINKSTTSTWEVFIQKTEAYDSIAMIELFKDPYVSARATITLEDTLVSSVSGYTRANWYTPNGGTITDPLVLSGATSKWIYHHMSAADISKSDNNLSSTSDIGFIVEDASGRMGSMFFGEFGFGGTVGSFIRARNYSTNGNSVGTNDFGVYVDKSGNQKYVVSNPTNFRGTITAAPNNWAYTDIAKTSKTYGAMRVARRGPFAYVKMNGIVSVTKNTQVTVFTLPSGYRPTDLVIFDRKFFNGNNVRIMIYAAGNVDCYCYDNTGYENFSDTLAFPVYNT